MDDSVIMCDEVIEPCDEDAEAKLNGEIKTFLCWQHILKMSNKVKDVNIKKGHTSFLKILLIQKILILIISKQIEKHTKMFLFTILNI